MVATIWLRKELRLAAEAFKFVGQIFAQMIDRLLVVTGRFKFHHALEDFQHVSMVFLAELKERGVVGGSRHR